ncbi:MAG: peptidase S41 [Legionellales bacterium]|nr:peptidase S41 [Legionellales bacterium]
MHFLKALLTCFFILISTSSALTQAAQDQIGQHSIDPISEQDVEHFATVMAQIQHYYIKPTTTKTLFENAIRGMLNGLDPHSSYLDFEEFKTLNTHTNGHYAGVGIQLIPENGLLKVIAPIDDSPAARANIAPGDIILKINNQFTKDLGAEKALALLSGKPGTKVQLTIFKKDEQKPKLINLIRQKIKLNSSSTKMLTPKVAYTRISTFSQNTAREISTQLKKYPSAQGLILDVRNNPGGTLDGATQTSDLFLDANRLGKNKLIVSIKGRDPRMSSSIHATPGDILKGAPIVVLINGGSASASEILASALAEHNRGVTLGTKTFGKGSVQAVIPTTSTSAIKITTALYYTPRNHAIQAIGVTPDITVPYQTIPQLDEPNALTNLIDESQLYKHLDSKPQKKQTTEYETHQKLAQDDFQLYQALKLAQGMLAMKN